MPGSKVKSQMWSLSGHFACNVQTPRTSSSLLLYFKFLNVDTKVFN